MNFCSPAEIAEKRRIALEKLKAKKAKFPNFSAAGIAEKRRIALEKLKAKKARLGNGGTNGNKALSTTTEMLTANIAISTEVSNTNSRSPQGRLPAFGVSTSGADVAPSTIIENDASSFLNAIKRVFIQRQQLSDQDEVHPYKKPTSCCETGNLVKKTCVEKPKYVADSVKNISRATQRDVAPVFQNSVSCKVAMVSPTRFEVQPSNFHSKLIEVFKTIPSREYDPITRFWNFRLCDYNMVQERVSGLKPDIVMGTIPRNVLNLCLAPRKEMETSCLESLEPTLANKLMPFQREGVCFAISQNARCMICDEMGLGKTYQAIAVADFYREDWPLLICTTASTRDSWANHIRELLPSVPLHHIQVLNSNQQYIGDCKVLITSYSMMEKNITMIMQREFGFLIFDESHFLKNSKAKCTMGADRLGQQAKHVILLSGTPALSRPVELFSQLRMIDRKFMCFTDFTSRYCNGNHSNFGWDVSGQSNLKELNVVLKLKYMIRRTKDEVLSDLSQKYRETVVLDPSLVWPSDKAKESLETVAKTLQDSKGHKREQILLKFYAQTAEVKTKAVCAYIKQQVKEPMKFIVFAHHRIMMDAICQCLSKLQVTYVRIDGNTRKRERGEFIDTFQKQSSCKVAVLSLIACNSGITLTAAELILFAELTWNPSTLAQAESRAHRIGQTNPVTCRYLMAKKTADDHIWNMLKAKQHVLNEAGIFCENLQDATYTIAPATSNKIDNYFFPAKALKSDHSDHDVKANSSVATNTTHNLNISKQIENIGDFFQDDNDEAFKHILCQDLH